MMCQASSTKRAVNCGVQGGGIPENGHDVGGMWGKLMEGVAGEHVKRVSWNEARVSCFGTVERVLWG